MDNQRQKLERRLEILKKKYDNMMRGRFVPTPAALKIKKAIDITRDEIKVIDRDAAERLALKKAPIDDMLGIIAIPLLADVMNDLVAGVDGMLRRNGCHETVFGDYTKQIRRAALAMIDTLAEAEADLPRLLDADDTLIDALRKKLMSFIKQRLNIKKTNDRPTD